MMAIFNMDFLYVTINSDNISPENYFYAFLFTIPLTFPVYYYCLNNFFPKSILKNEIMNYLTSWLFIVLLCFTLSLITNSLMPSLAFPNYISSIFKGYFTAKTIDLNESYNTGRKFVCFNAFLLYPVYSFVLWRIIIKFNMIKK